MASYSSGQRGQVDGAAPHVGIGSIVGAAVVVASLYLARDVLVPFVIAVLLSFVLAIPVRKLQGIGLGRTFPVAIVVMLAFSVILLVAGILTMQLTDLAGDLPRYQTTIREKIASAKGAASGSGPLERVADMLQSLSDEVSGKAEREAPNARTPVEATPEKPLPVEITKTRLSPISTITGYVTPILHPLATTGLIAIFTIFMLLQRADLRNRAIRLAGSHDLQRTTAAMNDAASRLSRFFLMQVLLNSSFGIVVGCGLWAISVPSPVLWGIMAAISRFIPYVGVVIAAGGPLILAAAVDPGWTMLATTAAFFAVSEFALGQIVEPLLYGHSTGLSPIAVIASVTFWTWLWGPIGLLLATPLTVCLVVLGRHVDQLAFLEVMFGDRPPLTVAESFYQRALAGDAGEMIEQADTFLKHHRLVTFYDEVAVKGLSLAQVDMGRGALDDERLGRISDAMAELVAEMADHEGAVVDASADKALAKRADGDEGLDETLETADARSDALPVLGPELVDESWRAENAVLAVAGRNELDRAGAVMLAQILGKHGLPARAEVAEVLTSTAVVALPDASTRIVVLSYLDAGSPAHVRHAVRRARRRWPSATIIVGSWGQDEAGAKTLCEVSRSDRCASRLTEAAAMCLEVAAAARVRDDPAPVARQERTDRGEVAA